MKADFLFVGLNLNTTVRRKRQKHARFMDDAVKTRKQGALKIFKYWNSVVAFPNANIIIKFLATRLVALLLFTKKSCGLFLIWSMRWLLVVVHFIYRNWPNFNLNPTLRIDVLSY